MPQTLFECINAQPDGAYLLSFQYQGRQFIEVLKKNGRVHTDFQLPLPLHAVVTSVLNIPDTSPDPIVSVLAARSCGVWQNASEAKRVLCMLERIYRGSNCTYPLKWKLPMPSEESSAPPPPPPGGGGSAVCATLPDIYDGASNHPGAVDPLLHDHENHGLIGAQRSYIPH